MKKLVSKRPLAISLATLVVFMFVCADKSAFGQELSAGDAVEIVAEGVKTGVEHVKHTATSKFLKHTDLSKAGTTRAQRKEVARQANRLTSTAKKALTKFGFEAVDALASSVGKADAWGTVLGHLSTLNLTSTTGAAANEIAEGASGAAGALALGKVGLIAGTAVGGPAGGIIGGGLFAAGGAVLGTLGYKVYLSDAVVNGVEKRFERDYKQYVIENRHEWRLKNDPFYLKPHERERAESLFRGTLGKTIEKVALDHPEVKDTNPNNTNLSGRGTYNPDRWDKLKRRAKALARKLAAKPEVVIKRDEVSKAVIPDIATIDAVFVPRNATGNDFTISFYRRGDEITARAVFSVPAVNEGTYGQAAHKIVYELTGVLRENVAAGPMSITWEPYEDWNVLEAGSNKGVRNRGRQQFTYQPWNVSFTFYGDGTVLWEKSPMVGQGSYVLLEGVVDGPRQRTWDFTTEAETSTGVWQYRAQGESK